MISLFKFAKAPFRRPPWPQLQFPTVGFNIVSGDIVLEEEQLEGFKKGIYYPIKIGDLFASQYQVVGKLGFGATSTVWLARDIHHHTYSTLKVFTREGVDNEEFEIYKLLRGGNSSHPGYSRVRTALDVFTIPRLGGDHRCLVQKPMWDSFRDLLNRNPTHRFTKVMLQAGLAQILLALDYIHTECKIVHTDIKSDNILIEIEDQDILDAFVNDEMSSPSPRKFVDGVAVYASRRFGLPKYQGDVVLSDFGSAVRGDRKSVHDAQPDIYRCPEVMLKTGWSYPADIWNVGAMVRNFQFQTVLNTNHEHIWDIYEDKHLFHGNDPDGKGYSTRAHLAEVVAMLGPPPLDLLARGSRSQEFFDDKGQWIAEVPIPGDMSLDSLEENLTGAEKREFLEFVRCMLTWKPEDRKTAKQLLDHPWLKVPS